MSLYSAPIDSEQQGRLSLPGHNRKPRKASKKWNFFQSECHKPEDTERREHIEGSFVSSL